MIKTRSLSKIFGSTSLLQGSIGHLYIKWCMVRLVVHINDYEDTCWYNEIGVHCNLPNIMHVVTKVHVILRRSTMFTCIHDNRELE